MEHGVAITEISDNARRALMLILSLDEDLVIPVLKHLDPDDIRTLHELSSTQIAYDPGQILKAYEEFIAATRQPVVIPGSERHYIERLAQRSLGRDETREILETRGVVKPFEGLEKHSVKMVSRVLADEDPQVVAAVISELSPAYASEVLSLFGRSQRAEVMLRLATLEAIPGSTFELLRAALDEQLADLDADDAVPIDGRGRVASILQRLPKDDVEDILAELEEKEAQLAQQLRREMFNFEDLRSIQGRGMQVLIKEIGNDQLLLALKTCSDELKDKILSSVSKRAAEVILDDLSVMGPVRLSEVEQAQQEIVDTALRLEAESKLVIAGRGGEELV
jgi:flagellar motor switch protein FliG